MLRGAASSEANEEAQRIHLAALAKIGLSILLFLFGFFVSLGHLDFLVRRPCAGVPQAPSGLGSPVVVFPGHPVATTEAVEGVEITTLHVAEGLESRLAGQPIFEPGKAVLLPRGQAAIRHLAATVTGYRNKIRVVGHAGRAEGRELAFARALAVVRYLETQDIHPARLEPAAAPPGEEDPPLQVIVTEALVPLDQLAAGAK